MKLEDLVDFNPRTPVPKGESAPFVDMASLPTGDKHFPVSAFRVFKGSGSKFKDGDTLLARITPCLENGKGGFVQGLGESVFAHGSTEFIVLRAKKVSDKDFTFYITKHPDFRAFAIKQMSGTSGRQRVAWQSLTDYELFDLRPEEREAIGKLLSALDDKIELNRRMNATLEAMARALFRDWFVDFGPTRAKMAGADPYLAPEIWSLFPDRLDDEKVPEGWQGSEIGQETKVVGGSTPSTKEPSYWGGAINWTTPKDLSSLNSPVLIETNRTITEAGLAKISSGLLPAGTVLLSSRAPVGYIAISAIPVAVNQGYIAMQCGARLSNVYVWLWLHENMEAIKGNANGSTFQEISKKNFRPLPVVVPSEAVMCAFNEISVPLYERIEKNEIESRTLAQTRDLLLPRLMSGEIRVREKEYMAEDTG